MAKDPAVLFYTSDFITGTRTMSYEQIGKYMILLCLQHQQGFLSDEDMNNICESYDAKIYSKFIKTEDGFYYNKRMKEESDKRKKYSQSRSQNRKHTCQSYDKHMENEIESINTTIVSDSDRKEKGVQGKKEGKTSNDNLKSQFEIFRMSYPGTKRGLDTEFNNLVKKHEDWREVVPQLLDKLSYQIHARDQMVQKKGFVPQWKNLQTWINNRCWEDEILIPDESPNAKRNGNAVISNSDFSRQQAERFVQKQGYGR